RRQVDGFRRGLAPQDDEGRRPPRAPVRDRRQQARRSLPGHRRQREEVQVNDPGLPFSPRAKDLIGLFAERILVIDGAMGTQIQQRNLTAADFGGPDLEGCNENLVLTRPDVVREIHAAYFAAGADIVETNSFGGTPFVLNEYGLGAKAEEINEAAARIAREAAQTFPGPRFVAGS